MSLRKLNFLVSALSYRTMLFQTTPPPSITVKFTVDSNLIQPQKNHLTSADVSRIDRVKLIYWSKLDWSYLQVDNRMLDSFTVSSVCSYVSFLPPPFFDLDFFISLYPPYLSPCVLPSHLHLFPFLPLNLPSPSFFSYIAPLPLFTLYSFVLTFIFTPRPRLLPPPSLPPLSVFGSGPRGAGLV